MKITELLDFQIDVDSIRGKVGSFYFFRILPPNLSILNPSEKQEKIRGFLSLLNTNQLPMQIFVMDKSEDLSKNKKFWQKIPDRYAFISDVILDSISEIESTSSGIQRAYYIVIQPKEREQATLFESLLEQAGFRAYRAEREELVTVMLNFLQRFYVEIDLFTLEREVQRLYENQKGKK